MSSIGRFINFPRDGYQFGRFRDEYGNSWNVNKDDIPKDADPDENTAYRLDFSQASHSPKIVVEDD